jgi:CubicO group peptidase (beta-lactamase class C family)
MSTFRRRYPASGLALRGLLAVVLGVPLLARQTSVGPAVSTAPPTVNGAERARAVDELFEQWHSPDSPGAAVLVIDDGKIGHARGYGMANLEHGVPIRPNTVFDIASVSKQFAAMSIALLEAEGRLSLDHDVRRYIPELPDFGHRITIRHLVHHTSGIRDWPGSLSIGGWSYEDVVSFSQILRMAFHQRELNFPPGEVYSYSNTGYNLLAEIVARASGQPFPRFTDDRIFQPLGMRRTHFHADHGVVVVNRAESYRPGTDRSFRHAVSNLTALGSSSLFTTIEDLAKWIDNVHARQPVVGSPGVIARLHERGKLNSGETIAYAFGQSVGEYRGTRVVNHTGSWAGYRSVLERFPEHRFAVAILANTTNINPSALARQIADLYLADRLGAPAATPSASTQPAATAGARRWQPSAADLQAYTGEFRSKELLTEYVLEVRGGELVAEHFRTGEIRLQPVEPDRFQAPTLGDVRFQRGAGGIVTSFTANTDRIRGLRFDRTGQ